MARGDGVDGAIDYLAGVGSLEHRYLRWQGDLLGAGALVRIAQFKAGGSLSLTVLRQGAELSEFTVDHDGEEPTNPLSAALHIIILHLASEEIVKKTYI